MPGPAPSTVTDESSERRARVTVDAGGLRIRVRPRVTVRETVALAVFGLVWCAWWTRAIGQDLGRGDLSDVVAETLLLVAGVGLVFPVLAWRLLGRDELVVTPYAVELRRSFGLLGRTRRFAHDDVRGVRWTDEPPTTRWWFGERPLFLPGSEGAVAFDAGGRTHRFADVSASEAPALVHAICQQLGLAEPDEAPAAQ